MPRTEPAFFPAFLGTLIAGAVPVPIYPPFRPDQIDEYAHRQRGILRNAGARVLVTFTEAQRVARLLRGAVPSLEHIVTIEQLGEAATGGPTSPSRSSDPALIQYTSGSTGDPKGVLLSHANILANIRAFGEALAVKPDDVAVSWLPLYHDMGLIGAWLGSLVVADGELFITGRVKDIIIQAGRNISAQEVEEAAGTTPGIRKGCVAAFGVHDPTLGTERLVLVAETRERDRTRWLSLRTAVQDRVTAAIGVPPDIVVITRPRTVLKTPSGKIRHSSIRDAYLKGTLGRQRPLVLQQMRLLVANLRMRAGRVADWSGRLLFTAYVTVIVGTTLPVLWLYLLIIAPGRRADRAVKWWSRLALTACGVRPRIVGLEHVRGVGAAILAANHASYIDSVVLMAAIPTDFRFVAKRRLADYPLIGTVIRRAGHVTIEKATVAQQLAGATDLAHLLLEGRQLLIFPEGTFFRPAGLLPFRLGAFKAAVDAGLSIVPIALRGTRHVLPAGTWLFRRGPIEVTIGAPLKPEAQGWQEMVRLRDHARSVIAQGSGESL